MQRLSGRACFTELSCCETCVRAQPVAISSKQVIFAHVHSSLKHSRAGADPGLFLGGDPTTLEKIPGQKKLTPKFPC